MSVSKQRCFVISAFLFVGSLLSASCNGEDGAIRPERPIPVSAAQAKASAPAGQWPWFLGPARNLITQETAWRLPRQGKAKIEWSKQIGTGFSAVSVADGRAITMGNVGGQEIIWCFDAATGRELWTHKYPAELVDNLHEGGPGSTPTIDGSKVFTLGREGRLFCLEAKTGRVVWSKNLQSDLGMKLPEWGFTSSPVILGDMLILEAGRLVAYNKTTGVKLWQTRQYPAGYGSPAVFLHKGQPHIASLNNDYLIVARAADGEVLARVAWETSYNTNGTTPLVHEDKIFVSTGYNKGCGLYRFTGASREKIYTYKDMSNHMANSVLWKGYLYGLSGNSHNSRNVRLVCMEFATGKEAWSRRGYGCGSLIASSDGRLLVLSDTGELTSLTATAEGHNNPIATVDVLNGRCWTMPVLAGGRVYCRNSRGHLVCVDVGTAQAP